jgi:NAD(P)-dependent dehydrogenase (short-subunit alcohol dehydrogenase family)
VELEGKVALVTGAAIGIGFAVARGLREAGAQVVVAEDDEVRRMIETAERFGGGLDILVNNAGGVDEPVYPAAPVERWERVLAVNLRAVMLATQLALEPLRRRDGGAIVNAICPDYVDTPAVQRELAQMSEEERAGLPELVSPDAIAADVRT